MVAILEIDKKYGLREKISAWWKVEGKIEIIGTLVVLPIMWMYWDLPFVRAGLAFFAGVWGFVKMAVSKRNQKSFLFIVSLIFFFIGIEQLLQ